MLNLFEYHFYHECGLQMAQSILKQTFLIMTAFSNQLHTFTMRMVDGRFSRQLMNTHGKLPSHLHDADSREQIHSQPS